MDWNDLERMGQLPRKDCAPSSYQWLCSYIWWFVTDECFKFGSRFLCSYSHFVWAMSWTEFSVPVHDVIWFKVFPFIIQYWNIFPCTMFVCWGVGGNVALLDGQHCVRKKRYRYWSTRCNEQLLVHWWMDSHCAAAAAAAGVTCFRDCLCLCSEIRPSLYIPQLRQLFADLTVETQVWSLNSPSKICDESSSTQYFSFPLSLSLD